MPIVDEVVGVVDSHIVLTFMDEYFSYNQIFVAKEDIHITTFIFPKALGIYEWVIITFILEKFGATY